MAKSVHDNVLDAALDYIASNCNIMVACSAQPTTYAQLTATYALADVALDSDDYTIANGDASGRKVTLGAQNTILIDATGTATHVGLGISGTSTLAYVTTCTSKSLTAGNTVNFPAWDIEIADPS